MPRRIAKALTAKIAIAAVTLAIASTSPVFSQAPQANPPKPAKLPDPGGNPLRDTATTKPAFPLPDANTPETDYRQRTNPDQQRTTRAHLDELPLFGVNFFEPARRAIIARREYFRLLLSGRETGPVEHKTSAENDQAQLQNQLANQDAPLTQEEKDAVAALTPAQQLDLLMRQRDNKLTDAERVKYRALLNPPKDDQGAQGATRSQTPDESDKLTTEQKVDLLQRQRANKLTPEEKQKYQKLLSRDTAAASLIPGQQQPNGISGISGVNGGSVQPGNILQNGVGAAAISGLYGSGGTRFDSRQFPNTANLQTNLPAGGLGGQGTFGQQPGLPSYFNPGLGNPPLDQYSGNYNATDILSGQLGRDQFDRRNIFGNANAYNAIVDPISQLYQNVSASVPVNYQLAGGDKVLLRISSPVLTPLEIPLTVDPMGAVMVPNAGRIVVLGQTLSQAESAIAARLVRIYRNAQVSLSVFELRTIPVTVAGESFAPGTYQIPAVATAFNLIYATGGPSDDGSMRQIEVRRRGKLVGNRSIDFYKFILTGDQTTDVQLEAGDVVYIPGRHGVVSIHGEVRRPGRFEVTEVESLKDLLQYAGGVKPSGVSQRIQVATLQPGNARLLKDVDVTALPAGPAVPVYDGDNVDVFSVRETLTNVVTVEGAVDQPGQYAVTPHMTVADLVERARGLLSEAYPTTAQLYRWNSDNTLSLVTLNLEKALARDPAANVPLTRWDRLTVFTREEVAWTGAREITIRGAVKKPGIYYRSDNMRVRDLLMLAGGTLPEAYSEQAYLLHQRPDGTFSYEFVSLAAAVKDDPGSNVLVQDKDVLAVYRTNEARFTPVHTLSIQGEVVSPGQFKRGDHMRLSDAIKIAGGLTPKAGNRALIAHSRRDEGSEPSASIYSASTATFSPDPEMQDGDIVTIQGRGSYVERPYVVNVNGAVNRPGPVVLSGPKVRLSEVIKQAGGLKPEAYPEGVEFYRDPSLLTTATQNQIASVVNKLNDILNQAEKEREKARSDIERIKAIGKAGQSSAPLAIPGITSGIEAPNPALASGTASIFSHDLVTPARQLTPEDLMPHGNVALNLRKAIERPGSDDDLLLLDGDAITVPVRPTTVTVMGAVVQSRGVVFREGARLDYYLSQVGGFTEDAAKDRVLVIRVGGGLAPIKQVKEFKPGDIIFVPTKVLAANISQHQTDYDSIFKSLTTSGIIFFVAKKLLGF